MTMFGLFAAATSASADMVYSEEYTDSTNGYYSTAALTISGDNTIDLTESGAKDGLSLSDGFTISLNVKFTTDNYIQWSHILGLTFNSGSSCFLATGGKDADDNNDSYLYVSNAGLSTGYDEGGGYEIADNTWYNVILTVDGDDWTLSVYDADGLLDSASVTYELADAYLTSLSIGGSQSGSTYDGQYNNRTSTLVDNIAVFDYVMTQTEQENLSSSTLGGYGVIPEPSTATLSLLALAGLCVRRRRK